MSHSTNCLYFFALAAYFLLMVPVQDAAVQPSLVILYFGGNDATNPHSSGLGAHVPLPEFIENMKKIIVYIKVCFFITHYFTLSTLIQNI